MDKFRNIVRQQGFQVAVFVLFLILFNWPLLSIVNGKGPWPVFLYLFTSWGVLVLILFLFYRGVYPAAGEEGKTNNDEHSGEAES